MLVVSSLWGLIYAADDAVHSAFSEVFDEPSCRACEPRVVYFVVVCLGDGHFAGGQVAAVASCVSTPLANVGCGTGLTLEGCFARLALYGFPRLLDPILMSVNVDGVSWPCLGGAYEVIFSLATWASGYRYCI